MIFLFIQKKQFPCGNKGREEGYIALVSIFFVSALIFLIISSISLISIGESSISLRESDSEEAFYLATACAEEALMRLKEEMDYQGSETLIFDRGSCTILEIEGSGNRNRILKIEAEAGKAISRIKVEIDTINPEMIIQSWQEIGSF